MLKVKPLKTEIFKLGSRLDQFLLKYIKGELHEGQVLAITSKIVSLAEGRVISKSDGDKSELVQKESDVYLGQCAYGCHLTIKHGLLIPSAGIDESNSESGEYILYPLDPFASAVRIYNSIKETLKLKNFGVLLTDSHSTPLRRGVIGVALGFHGFKGLDNKIGNNDLFGRPLQMTQINRADSLAVAAVSVMGEGDESCPLAIIESPLEFCGYPQNKTLGIPIEEDIFWPLFKGFHVK